MCFIISFIPATLFIIIAYFILFSSQKTEGMLHLFAKILAIWLFVVAAFYLLFGAYLTVSGLCPVEKILEQIAG